MSIQSPVGAANPPLRIELDGTLIRTGTLWESLVRLLTKRPWLSPMVLIWLSGGKARLEAELASRVSLDPAMLPYDPRVLAFLAEQKSEGRRLLLVAGSNRRLAEQVAAHLGLFDALTGPNEDESQSEPLLLPTHNSRFPALVRALRPYQWSKNLLAFVPIVTSGELLDWTSWATALLVVVAFSAMASGSYIWNDLSDLEADRAHPRKRNRPFASGELPLSSGFILAPVLWIAGLLLAASVHIWPAILLYAAVSMAYTLLLKEQPLIDVFALAFVYMIRLYAGGMATGHYVSMWLLAFSAFLFLGLALMKRTTELADAKASGREIVRRAYSIDDLPMLRTLGVSASFVSSMVLALYVQSPEIEARYSSAGILWALVPLLLFWQMRMWLMSTRGQMHDDPIVSAARDRITWLLAVLVLLTMILAAGGFDAAI